MKSRDFCYWLQGFFELQSPQLEEEEGLAMSAEQVDVIRRHLALVFKHEIDPSHSDDPDVLKALQKIHDGPGFGPAGGGRSGMDTPLMC